MVPLSLKWGKMKFRTLKVAAVGAAVLGLVLTAAPAQAYTSTKFTHAPSNCWGSVEWFGSSWFSGNTSLASTSENNNPCFSQQVSSAVRLANGASVNRRYDYNYASSSYSEMSWSFGGYHSFGNASGSS
jgi:hypothetical protein